jgi:membrane peptidoglycan carboxypeptidase
MSTDIPAAGAPRRSARHEDKPGRNRLTRWWHRRSRWAQVAILVPLVAMVLFFVALLGIVWAATRIDIPGPDEVNNTDQTTIVYYSDGKTEIGRLSGEVNRINIKLKDVPKHVQDAVLAAEDRKFYEHSGVSFRGIARAAYRDIRGGGTRQGGSTIPQQYAKNAFLSSEKTFARKFKEAVLAVKIDRKYSKEWILESYLNTIYWGRGASGVEAAARTYFGKPARRLTVEEGAFLAGIIRAPEAYDPDEKDSASAAKVRFQYVLDGMVEMGTVDPTKAQRAKFPKVRERQSPGVKGPNAYVMLAVRRELVRKDFTEDDIYRGGLRIVTTIDKRMQDAALATIKEYFADQPKDLQQGMLSVDPKTGAIRAMYGGRERPDEKLIDYTGVVGSAKRQPGSSFKPYVLAAAIDDGWSLKSRYNGKSPGRRYPDRQEGVKNYGNQNYGWLDLTAATAKSVNTIYVDLGNDVGLDKVIDAANRAGIRDRNELKRSKGSSLPLGTADVPVVDQAVGFATFANGGQRATAYIVQQVKTANGKSRYQAKPKLTRAFDEDVAADVTHAMTKVLQPGGTAPMAALDGNRPAAGKTGTTQKNGDAWFVGYTPQLSTAVWVGFDDHKPLKNVKIAGQPVNELTGGRGPALVWKAFMDQALEGQPVEEFPPPAFIGKAKNATPSPRPTTPSPTPTTMSPTPSPTPTPKPTTSSPTPSPSEPTILPTGTNNPDPSQTANPEPTQEADG